MILSSTLEILKECLPMEATAVMKFKEGAVNTNDAVLRGLYEQAASQHLNHYNTLLNILNEKQNNQNRILFLSLLSVQRSLSIKYNECSMKCADEPLREDILNILRENHAMYHTLFDESRSRGWETESAAESDEVSAASEYFSYIKGSL